MLFLGDKWNKDWAMQGIKKYHGSVFFHISHYSLYFSVGKYCAGVGTGQYARSHY
ncbi:Uncharacterised protein [Serratia fonticola]|uniref:Uncharacterized protein n=1 Tax=Serratia fonticola TaxID=47917 RepID=A0A4U9WJW2_SERFO|nr:Uncharacterised protein [Serratia fonticola]